MTSTRQHPKALPYLFLTEMWERFGFYIVQGMMVLYMIKKFGFSDEESYAILGAFSALAYIVPMLGGFIADRMLGFKKAIFLGGILLSLGYGYLAFLDAKHFYVGLGIIVVGNAFFKPNISSLLGALYKPGDTGRDAGFTLFYMGINLGVLLSGIASSLVQHFFSNWQISFLLASIGLIVGLFTFAAGCRFGNMHYDPHVAHFKNTALEKNLLFVGCLILTVLSALLIKHAYLAKLLFSIVGVLLLFLLFYLAFKQEKEARSRLLVLNILIMAAVVYWTIYLQMFFSVTLFIERSIDRSFFSTTLPTTVFYPINNIFIILCGPLFVWAWHSLNKRNLNPSPLLKFVFGISGIGIAFLLLAMSTYFTHSNLLVCPLWIVITYFLIAFSELMLSPIGLSAVTLLSPPNMTGMMMGAWFVALGFGGHFAGLLAKIASVPEPLLHDPAAILVIYRHAFVVFALIAIGIGFLLFLIQRALKDKLHNQNQFQTLD